MSGLAVLVYDGGDAVICNVVGHVSVGKLIQIAAQSKKLPKDLLQKLMGASGATSAPEAAKAGDDTSTNAPAETPAADTNAPAAK
jgi:hypothetical protein